MHGRKVCVIARAQVWSLARSQSYQTEVKRMPCVRTSKASVVGNLCLSENDGTVSYAPFLKNTDIRIGMTTILRCSHSHAVVLQADECACYFNSIHFSSRILSSEYFYYALCLILSPPTSFFATMWSPYCGSKPLL